MTIEIFCPKWYFNTTLSKELQEKTNELFGEYLADENNFGQPTEWACNVKSTWQKTPESEGPWLQWLPLLRPVFDQFMDEVGRVCDLEIVPQNAWANKYNPGDYQEVHDHCTPTSNISMVYFHTVNDDDSAKFMFYNTEHAPYRLQGLSDTLRLPINHQTVPDVGQGDILIFPSHYLHLVTPHRGSQTRITFSMNFLISPVTPEQAAQNP